jgi:hypothetical protein
MKMPSRSGDKLCGSGSWTSDYLYAPSDQASLRDCSIPHSTYDARRRSEWKQLDSDIPEKKVQDFI